MVTLKKTPSMKKAINVGARHQLLKMKDKASQPALEKSFDGREECEDDGLEIGIECESNGMAFRAG
jgi:hypothetical protein